MSAAYPTLGERQKSEPTFGPSILSKSWHSWRRSASGSAPGLHKRGDNQVYRARVLEVRIHLPPGESPQTFSSVSAARLPRDCWAERLPVWIRTRPAPADPTSIATLHDEAIAQMAIALWLITLAFGPVVGRNPRSLHDRAHGPSLGTDGSNPAFSSRESDELPPWPAIEGEYAETEPPVAPLVHHLLIEPMRTPQTEERRPERFKSHSRRSAGADSAGQFRPADCLRHPGLSARDGRKRRVPCGQLRAQVAFGLRTRHCKTSAPHASGYVTAKMSPISVSRADARRIWLHAQRLDERKPFGAGQGAVQTTIEHLGYVQIDTINVIERCHHHILFSRIPDYRRADLHHIQSVEKSVFEYWTHALAYVPISDFRFYLRQMRQHRRKPVRWNQAVAPKDYRRVVRMVRENGPITIRDIEDGGSSSGTS
jgi:Winged helix DNA-binding domain